MMMASDGVWWRLVVVMDRGGVGARKRGEERKKEKNKDTGRLRNGVFRAAQLCTTGVCCFKIC